MSLFQQSPIILASKRSGAKPIPKGYVPILVDRTTVLGNPFHIEACGSRQDCIAEHRRWLKQQIREKSDVWEELQECLALLNAGKRIALVCWCVPKQCHAENYRDYLLWKLKK